MNTTYEYSYRVDDPDDFIGAIVYGTPIAATQAVVYLMNASRSPIGSMIMSWSTCTVTVP